MILLLPSSDCLIVVNWQALLHQNQPYDESLEVPDAEEIASTYSPTPRVPNPSGESWLQYLSLYTGSCVTYTCTGLI